MKKDFLLEARVWLSRGSTCNKTCSRVETISGNWSLPHKETVFIPIFICRRNIYIYIYTKKKKKINLKRPVIYNLFPLIVFFVYKRIICTNVVVPLWNQSLGSHVAISIEKRWWQAVMFSLKTNSTRENHKNISQDMKESKLSSIVQKKVFFMLYIFIFIFNFLCRSTSFFLRRTIQINLTQIK